MCESLSSIRFACKSAAALFDTCKQQASLIRRAAALLNVLSDAEVLKIVRDG